MWPRAHAVSFDGVVLFCAALPTDKLPACSLSVRTDVDAISLACL